MDKDTSISVIHLVWLPYGVELFRQFIDSYVKFSSGCEHTLLLVFNGVNNTADTGSYHDYAKKHGINYSSFDVPAGQDLECYFTAAKKISVEYIMILNSFSVILHHNWLKLYIDNFSDSKTGVVGSSASNQSYYSSVFQKNIYSWEKDKEFSYTFRKYKLFIKAFFYWRFLFKPFPNPHIRTNAFMIKRTLFLQLKHKPFVSKFAAYQFESGRKGFTKQLKKMGLYALVVDKNGKTYKEQDWKSSSTFWINNQENLLIADNQTNIYTAAAIAEKKKMTWLAWGTT